VKEKKMKVTKKKMMKMHILIRMLKKEIEADMAAQIFNLEIINSSIKKERTI
jgi:hypothetical protein